MTLLHQGFCNWVKISDLLLPKKFLTPPKLIPSILVNWVYVFIECLSFISFRILGPVSTTTLNFVSVSAGNFCCNYVNPLPSSSFALTKFLNNPNLMCIGDKYILLGLSNGT